MELLSTIALVILLVAVLGLLIWAWYYHMSEGGFWNFWMAFNLMDCIGKVAGLLITILVSSFTNDS